MITQTTVKNLIKKTRELGYDSQYYNSTDIQLEDPEIRLNDNVVIQLGITNGGMSVVKETKEGKFIFSNEFSTVEEVLEYVEKNIV